MGVVCCAEMQLSTQILMKLSLKPGGETNIAIGDHGNLNPVTTDYLYDVDVSQLLDTNAL